MTGSGEGEGMKRTEIWVFIFILGLVGLNWPLLEIFRRETVVYLFGVWIVIIALIAFSTRKSDGDRRT